MPDNNHKNNSNAFQHKTSYKRILETTILFGGSSLFTVLFRIVRGKIFAILVGPYGVGLLGMFNAIIRAGALFFNVGLPTSAVRQISSARGTGNTKDISTSILALVTIMPILSLIGGLTTWLLRDRISLFVFNTVEYSQEIGWLGPAILLMMISAAFVAILQGYQKVKEMVYAEILSSALASAMAVIIILVAGKDGIVFAVVAIAFIKFSVNLFYVFRIPMVFAIDNYLIVFQKILKILRFGFLFMLAALLQVGSQFLIRIVITRELGIEHAGYFQAANAISITYASFILRSMGRDYYPNLTRHAFDHKQMARLVNEQIHIALVLGTPFFFGLMTFAPIVVNLFYSNSFSPAVPLLRFFILTLPLWFMSWPMGFVILAKGRSGVNFLCEIPKNLIFIIFSIFTVQSFGITGAGIGFLCANGLHCPLIGLIIYKLIGFKIARMNLIALLILMGGSGAVLTLSYISLNLSYIFGCTIVLLSFFHAGRELAHLTGISPMKWLAQKKNSG